MVAADPKRLGAHDVLCCAWKPVGRRGLNSKPKTFARGAGDQSYHEKALFENATPANAGVVDAAPTVNAKGEHKLADADCEWSSCGY